ncbi:MAG: site-2 protease family protein [Cyanobacteria bacterium J06649_5]
MAKLFIAFALATVTHVLSMAIALFLCGVTIQRISFGLGPALLKFGIVTVSPLLAGGSVTMLDSRMESIHETDLSQAFNHQPMWVQVWVPLSGVVGLGAVAYGLTGSAAVSSFLAGFAQIIQGGLSPLGTAQRQLQSVQQFCEASSLQAVLGMTAAKLAAFNVLPLPGLNGGQALINLVKQGHPQVAWEAGLVQWLIWPGLLLGASWYLAMVVYLFRLFA